MELTPEEMRRVFVVYSSALAPPIILFAQWLRGRLESWFALFYAISFAVCAFGWEIWFTYGLWAGQNVDGRRGQALNQAIPEHINWLLNSLADAGSISLVGILMVLAVYRSDAALRSWRWPAFGILLGWFIAQNVFVELYLYHEQLSVGSQLSWAPLAPTGPWWNPILFETNGRTLQLQTQLPWLIATPILYAAAIGCFRNLNKKPATIH